MMFFFCSISMLKSKLSYLILPTDLQNSLCMSHNFIFNQTTMKHRSRVTFICSVTSVQLFPIDEWDVTNVFVRFPGAFNGILKKRNVTEPSRWCAPEEIYLTSCRGKCERIGLSGPLHRALPDYIVFLIGFLDTNPAYMYIWETLE